MRTRQVHLDFHTSEHIKGIGSAFDAEQFKTALKEACVNSITLFAKCHHSWCYYDSKVGKRHPHLDFNLLDEQMKAARELGIKVSVYITAGWSDNDAKEHPEWLGRNQDGSVSVENYDMNAAPTDSKGIVSWQNLCLNGPYTEHIYELTREVCDRYEEFDGLFYDICFFQDACWCDSCRKGMRAMGLDENCQEDAERYLQLKRKEFMDTLIDIKNEKHPNADIFFNGSADIYREWAHPHQTHYEIENLPTIDGSYDKLLLRMQFFSKYQKFCVGMTGKFHLNWGEFGGYKTPEALKYECASMLSYGAGCCVGDQLHPLGFADKSTYRNIGTAFSYVKELEPYCYDCQSTARIGLYYETKMQTGALKASVAGAVQMLLELHEDFQVVTEPADFEKYELLILPDYVYLDEEAATHLNSYLEKGGKILFTCDSGLNVDKANFLLKAPVIYEGAAVFDKDYVEVRPVLSDNMVTGPILYYSGANRVRIEDRAVQVLAHVKEPYFSRTYAFFCSHQNTPYKPETSGYPAAVWRENVIYAAHALFKGYTEHGAIYHRRYFENMLRLLLPEKIVEVKLPSAARVRLVKQVQEERSILHLLYGIPTQTGEACLLDNFPELKDIPVTIKAEEAVKTVKLVPQNDELEFRQEKDKVSFLIPKLYIHQAVVMEWETGNE